VPDRQGQSYRFSFGEVMRSPVFQGIEHVIEPDGPFV
jgi:hypothetical protein